MGLKPRESPAGEIRREVILLSFQKKRLGVGQYPMVLAVLKPYNPSFLAPHERTQFFNPRSLHPRWRT
jgi:hypothetical protein